MMRSLWAGVSGLQAHQIAMDVEGNNIANVNTSGFKYSRANFSDMLSQTAKIATAPQGNLGGKNPMQVGLGTEVNSVTRIFSQGSVQATGKSTDLAIQGDGFFVVSQDGGTTYKYSRNGDFVFDSDGNFVTNNGLVAQGWVRDPETGKIDTSAPIQNIQIKPGLTTPAKPSSEVSIKANLNAGNLIENMSVMETTDRFDVLFNAEGKAFNLKNGQGITLTVNGNSKDFKFDQSSNAGDNFTTVEDLRQDIENFLQQQSGTATVSINDQGKFEIKNPAGGADLKINVGGVAGGDNELFTQAMTSLSGTLTTGSSGAKTSQVINAATHASSIDIFDSLGSKHTVRMEFRKAEYQYDNNNTKVGAAWSIKISVPQPGEIGGTPNANELKGQIIFNSDGSLSSYTPTSITYTANNGSSPNQTVILDLGHSNKFDGLTSFDSPSNTAGISQDGYTGGDIDGIRIDQSGTLIGSFTNGRSFGLAQVAMAKFTNNIGLESEGGNVFVQTANSGEPVIGQAAAGGRGFVQSSSLEMSNVDLSRSLTQLIVIQRGFQANSKTITTSDQMLNTLLQLKQ
ncbi:MAG: flagellar hook protein FlgE [Sulfurospirillum sp.]|nr:MAG: flagellar hook protein FlgE [Sulfurospirillum sp.]